MRSLRPSPGGHAIWWFVNADSAQEALDYLPSYVASRTVVVDDEDIEIP